MSSDTNSPLYVSKESSDLLMSNSKSSTVGSLGSRPWIGKMGTLESIPEYRNDMQTAHMAVGYPNQSHFTPIAWPAYSLRYG